MVLYPNKLPESERVCSGICKISHFKKKSCMKLLYIFLLSFVVGSRRLSGYYY